MTPTNILNFLRYESTKKRIESRIDQLYDLYDVLENELTKREVMFKIRALEYKLNTLTSTTRI